MNTEIFTGKAEVYDKARPSYPDEAVEYICGFAPSNAVFADVGAGTGKFTELIAKRSYSLFAIEPNSDMRAQLIKVLRPYPKAKIIHAPAEATTLPCQSVDVIIVAQALHWFDAEAFRVECKRICKSNGIVVAVYNIIPGRNVEHRSQTATKAFFRNPVVKEFSNSINYTRERWLQQMLTRPNDPLPDDPSYATHLSEMNAIFDKESKDGLMFRPFVTTVFSEAMK
jgi:ubiquinone/menaquinone biosynthesis C-methylase UbiE